MGHSSLIPVTQARTDLAWSAALRFCTVMRRAYGHSLSNCERTASREGSCSMTGPLTKSGQCVRSAGFQPAVSPISNRQNVAMTVARGLSRLTCATTLSPPALLPSMRLDQELILRFHVCAHE